MKAGIVKIVFLILIITKIYKNIKNENAIFLLKSNKLI